MAILLKTVSTLLRLQNFLHRLILGISLRQYLKALQIAHYILPLDFLRLIRYTRHLQGNNKRLNLLFGRFRPS